LKFFGFTPRKEGLMAIRGSGELKIEFYAHLEEIKDLYFNQGLVVMKILHKKIVEKHKLSLDYQAFCYYARKELKREEHISIQSDATVQKKQKITQEIEQQQSNNEDNVIIASPNFSKVKKFIPYNEN